MEDYDKEKELYQTSKTILETQNDILQLLFKQEDTEFLNELKKMREEIDEL